MLKDVERWFFRSEQDWITIRALLASVEKSWSQITFHSQQASEKCLKAFIAFHSEEPRRTHDLKELYQTAQKFSSFFTVDEEDWEFLTQFAVDSRYGDFDDEFSEENALAAWTRPNVFATLSISSSPTPHSS